MQLDAQTDKFEFNVYVIIQQNIPDSRETQNIDNINFDILLQIFFNSKVFSISK